MNVYHDINEARLNSFFKSVEPNLRSIIILFDFEIRRKVNIILYSAIFQMCILNTTQTEIVSPAYSQINHMLVSKAFCGFYKKIYHLVGLKLLFCIKH